LRGDSIGVGEKKKGPYEYVSNSEYLSRQSYLDVKNTKRL